MRSTLLLGALSLVFAATASAQYTQCNNTPLVIPDSPAPAVSNTIVVPGTATGTITEASVTVNATHSWIGDLIIRVSRGATTTTLIDRPGFTGTGFGCSGNNFNNTFDDDGTVNGETGCLNDPANPAYPAGAQIVPFSPLSAWDGQTAPGTWTLTVSDNAGGDTGQINSWCINLAGVIPVELSRFDATVSGRDVVLEWETASETNNAG
ncbi:MAG TPA: proprotein convertase P-domain-containing protein, partial [Rubricoccaceae bacterium]|nr:proprotein convertase P-domain-containing protein [Rubricoccaceae bacterium]